ncbi:hypothetical protein BABINDRAFT_128159 [Babjeviella inositovora NRRL Y-12698]|uniref:Uncharacterized protein n=1 Tax=Babjeviella inositovora NRRL Y-12698 TaxID=984486 RepID=A0A1E3QTI6_9ASCO|nr:uncharacterized protein BABINDRAFT_128159 [Babjeviella inositovora NRRL Y-12698]ODQ80864.1 hypothetical protein BABINDRAFT_128159 [Babjeviella inositovora NRRL Y-12698]
MCTNTSYLTLSLSERVHKLNTDDLPKYTCPTYTTLYAPRYANPGALLCVYDTVLENM